MSVVMPQLGESIVEATLAKWHVQPGDRVERGQILAEVETDKATNEIPAPDAGVVDRLLVKEGDTVPVGRPIMELKKTEAHRSSNAANQDQATPSKAQATPSKTQQRSSAASTDESQRLPSKHLALRPDGRRASPAVRRIARERGLDLNQVRGSGKEGRITREDVIDLEATFTPATSKSTASQPQQPSPEQQVPAPQARQPNKAYRPQKYTPQPGDITEPFSRRRQLISEHMVHSLQTSAHVAAIAEIDMSAVAKARLIDAETAHHRGVKLTFTAYVVQAIVDALDEYPQLNATVVDEALVLRRARNIGVAVDTEQGLIVPVIKRAEELGLFGIARAIDQLSEKAREEKLTAEDLSSGSFTISNPGRDGNLFGISIIRQPEVAILRMGAIVKRAVVRQFGDEDAIVIRPIMYVALSYDHRVIDGRTANGFLTNVRQRLEEAQPVRESLRP